MKKILLCSDLDRTILPNGEHEESRGVRRILARFVEQDEVVLAYVSGRNKSLIQAAIEEFEIPEPDFAIGDVGTTLYRIDSGHWHHSEAWEAEIASDWRGRTAPDLAKLLAELEGLTPQEPEQQGRFKLSFYVSLDSDKDSLLRSASERIESERIKASLIWSVDEARQVGLVDVLPKSATKLHAVRFLQGRLGFESRYTLYAGDSGNDLPVLISDLRSVLVANASDDVRDEALRESERRGTSDRLYLARGFRGLNGNYAAGVLEGVAHFVPESRDRLERLLRESG